MEQFNKLAEYGVAIILGLVLFILALTLYSWVKKKITEKKTDAPGCNPQLVKRHEHQISQAEKRLDRGNTRFNQMTTDLRDQRHAIEKNTTAISQIAVTLERMEGNLERLSQESRLTLDIAHSLIKHAPPEVREEFFRFRNGGSIDSVDERVRELEKDR